MRASNCWTFLVVRLSFAVAVLVQVASGQSGEPVVTGITPSSGAAGTSQPATISGTGLGGATAVTFSGSGVTATIGTGGTATSLPITVTIAAGASTDTRTLTVTTPIGTSPAFSGFTVTSVPIITGISPSSGAAGTSQPATISGTGLGGATAVTFSGSGVTATIETGGTATSLPITVTIAAGAGLGARTVTVTTPNGTSAPFSSFTVTQARPVITGISPNSGVVNSTLGATVSGTGFTGATAVVFSGSGVTATISTGRTDTSLPVTITIASDAPLAARSVNVIAPQGNSDPFNSFTVTSAPTWTNIGPGPDYVRVVRIDPVTQSTLYAGMVFEGGHYPVGGVFKSIDGGHTWSNSSRGMPTNPDIYSLAIDPKTPSTLYAGNYDGGVYKSLDGGATWTATMSPPLSNPKVYSLAIDPQTTSTVYVGMAYSGLYKSTDGGGTWNAATTGMPANPSVYTIAVDPNTPSTVYAGLDSYGVSKSTDSGAHWSAASRGLPADADIAAIAINPVTPSTLYAATEEISGTTAGWVYISTDSGSTWSPVSTGLPVTACGLHALAIDPVTTSTVYAGEFGCGVYKSTNSGGNWSPLNTGLPDPYVHSIAIVTAAPTTVYAGSCNTGVYVLTQPVGIQSLTISATGAASTFTPGPFGPLITGYVSGTVKAGSAPYATAVFSNTQNGVVVSEAGVPASPPTIAARFFVDSRTKVGTTSGNGTVDILTGFAVANGNSTAANLNLN